MQEWLATNPNFSFLVQSAPGSNYVPFHQVTEHLFEAIRFFFSFIHLKEVPQGELDAFRGWRKVLLDYFATSQSFKMPPCIHYLCEHLLEDVKNFGPLYYLLCEGAEAAHARDNKDRRATMKRCFTAKMKWNTWACMLRNFYARLSLMSSGTLALCVGGFFFH